MRAAIGFTGLAVLVGLTACGPGRTTPDTGGGGIDANVARPDAPAMMCGTMGPENTAAACGDGCDNDGNGFFDCSDFSCCGAVACAPGTACGDRGDAGPRPDANVMACATMGPENTAAACGDGCDNDGNGFFDCGDFDCCGEVTCGPATDCGSRPDAGRPDADVAACPAMGPGTTAIACAGPRGNDSNGLRLPGGLRCSATPPCPMTRTWCIENTLALCMDGMDNDSDRFSDCDDRDCCTVRPTGCPMGTYIGDGRCM